MKRARIASVAMLLGLAVFIVSCSDSVSNGPNAVSPQADLVGDLLGGVTSAVKNLGLLKCKQSYAQTVATIDKSGGNIQVGPNVLSIPSGALDGPVTITATTPKGDVDLVEFQPAGLVFKKAASLTMSYGNCSLLGSLVPKRIAYTDDALQILEYLLSIDNLLTQKVTGKVKHFSGYAVAW